MDPIPEALEGYRPVPSRTCSQSGSDRRSLHRAPKYKFLPTKRDMAGFWLFLNSSEPRTLPLRVQPSAKDVKYTPQAIITIPTA